MAAAADYPLPPLHEGGRLAKPEDFMHLREDSFQSVPNAPGIALRDTEIEKLTGGAIGVRIIKAVPGAHYSSPWHYHEWGYQIGYITKGWAIFEFEGIGRVKVEAGTLLLQPSNNRHRELETSDDWEAIEITWPAKVGTTVLLPNHETGSYDVVDNFF